MARDLARRDLLRGRLKGTFDVMRPPYAVHEVNFVELCQSAQPCKECSKSCPTGIIKFDPRGHPKLNFGQKTCTFCRQCETACSVGALELDGARPWTIEAQISRECLSMNGVMCRLCGDHCDENAITFKLMIGGRSTPLISANTCTGCGACMVVCPNNSIKMASHRKTNEQEIQ